MTVYKPLVAERVNAPARVWSSDGKVKYVKTAKFRLGAPGLALYRKQGDSMYGALYTLEELASNFGEVTDVKPIPPVKIVAKTIKNQWHAVNAYKKVGVERLPVITASGFYGELVPAEYDRDAVRFEFDSSFTQYELVAPEVVYPLHYYKAVPEGEDE